MHYLFEHMDPERFQSMSQALIARSYPHTQCFPVAQPDGGRDAISISFHSSAAQGFIVFQVKFVRNPSDVSDPYQWLTDIIKKETSKIEELIALGATEYILVTNIKGSAHLHSGSIDKVSEFFKGHIAIPAMCWWRDDISRRIDDAWDIKWAYPELLSGPDILRILLETGLTEDASRRTFAIQAFLSEQVAADSKIRFKQVDLQNSLLDLFVDIPLLPIEPEVALDRRRRRRRNAAMHSPMAYNDLAVWTEQNDPTLCAVEFLMRPETITNMPRIVLEGAPGQGKSTVTQYLCQLCRLQLLGANGARHARFLQTAAQFQGARIPIRADLRDYATWLERKNPFAVPPIEAAAWNQSLESFLAAQIQHQSGGVAFTVADLHAIARIASLTVVLDGLDEVPEINKRQTIVSEVRSAANRMASASASFQLIVTSRPAAFSQLPGFPSSEFSYLALGSLRSKQIAELSDKWITAKSLSPRDGQDIKNILEDQIERPHIRDLARNPMQLTILLSLIHQKGPSLPDKRTALYNAYVDLFLSREADKSPVVRKHLDLMLDLHLYLAWILHSEAETGASQGSFTSERLMHLVTDYLQREEHDTKLAEDLFAGMLERIVFLVSRIEGTYEFEVQTLREYFAGRHLYSLAPPSPSGQESEGSRPDRFDALCRNFYWTNALRFYAGCYSKGELPSLVNSLQDLAEDSIFQHTNHPSTLASLLISDRVFAQDKRSQRASVKIAIDNLKLSQVAATPSRGRRANSEFVVLPSDAGRDELVEYCHLNLVKSSRMDASIELGNLLTQLTTPVERITFWKTLHWDRSKWDAYSLILLAQALSILRHITQEDFKDAIGDHDVDEIGAILLIMFERSDLIENSSRALFRTLNGILNRAPSRYPFYDSNKPISIAEMFATVYDPFTYSTRSYPTHNFANVSEDILHGDSGNTSDIAMLEECRVVIERAQSLLKSQGKKFKVSLKPWDEIIELSREHFGERWAHTRLANIASAVRSSSEKGDGSSELFDQSISLVQRMRYARLRSGHPAWWEQQIRMATSQNDLMLLCLSYFSWAGMSVLEKTLDSVCDKVDSVDSQSFDLLVDGLSTLDRYSNQVFSEPLKILDPSLAQRKASPRAVTLLSNRFSRKSRLVAFHENLSEYAGSDAAVLRMCLHSLKSLVSHDPNYWGLALETSKRSYAQGVSIDWSWFPSREYNTREPELAETIASEVAMHPSEYPRSLVRLAEDWYRQESERRMIPISRVAEQQDWTV